MATSTRIVVSGNKAAPGESSTNNCGQLGSRACLDEPYCKGRSVPDETNLCASAPCLAMVCLKAKSKWHAARWTLVSACHPRVSIIA